MDQPNPTFAKILILDTGKFKEWKFRIQQYLQNKHYALWEIIEFGDSYKAPLEESGKGPASESSLRFSKYETAKELWEAILKTFGGNEATKKTKKNQLKQQYGNFKAEGPETLEQTFNRLQAIVSHLKFMDVEIKQDNLNQKFLTSLAPEWLMYNIVWRNRDDLDTMSLDDVGKGKVHTASIQVSTASTDVAAVSLSHDTVCAYIASQSNGSQIKYEDITQIDEDDIEEINIKWNMALLKNVEYLEVKTESYMANEEENHGLVADEEVPTEFSLMAKSSLSSENEVKAGLVEFKEQEIKFFEKIRGLERDVEVRNNKIEYIMNELEQNKEGLGYNAVPPPHAQVYSPPKKDLSCIGLPEFIDDTVTDYSRLTPSIDESKCNTSDLQSNNFFVSEHGESLGSIMSKPMIKFVKAVDYPRGTKTNNTKNARKSTVKYAEMYRNTSKSPKVRAHSNVKRPFQGKSAVRTQPRVPRVSTVTKKFLTVDSKSKFPTAKSTFTVDLGNKRKAGNINDKGYWDSGCSQHMTGNISYLFEYEPYDGRYVSFGQGEGKITGKGIIKLAEAVNTACYAQNRVLVNKSQNKTPYELFNSKIPAIGFLRPFGCYVMILNTLDHLGKFDAKGDGGYFVGYSMSSKAFRVFNKRTKKVEENLHVDFLENKLIEKGGISSTNISGTQDVASQAVKKDVSSLRYIALLNWFHEAHIEMRNSNDCITDDPESSGIFNPTATSKVPLAEEVKHAVSLTVEIEIPTFNSPVPTPPGFQDLEFPDRVYKVEKAMYGLHQAHRAWFEFEALVHEKFQMSVMGELTFFLGLQVLQKKDGIFLSQDKYVGDILKKFGYSDVRPNIMFAVYACARHQVTPKECHLYAVKRIFRYLKGHPKLRLWYPKESPFDLVAYLDSDYGSATQDRKSTIGGHTIDFHQIVDFLEASHIRIETTNLETKILATIDGKPRTISKSSLMRHLKLNDEEGISSLPDTELFENLSLSKALSPAADEPASLLRDDRQGESFPTVSSLDAGQDRENINKTSALPYESSPRVTSLDADEGRQRKYRAYSKGYSNQRGIMKTGEEVGAEKSTKLGSNDTEEMVNVLSSMEAANILTSGVEAASVSPVAGVSTTGVPTVSGSFPTISAIFTTASVKMVESEVLKKRKLQEQIDAQVAKEMEEEFARENQRMSEQLARDSKIARLHAEEELKMMI
nr:retrovirus-related Pol polyprotein from transposon TNT 1-94 [Tanacetum cinerariifolium]